MKETTILPNPASVLRAIITAAGFRPALEEKGLGKDLDDMASDKRPSSTCDLIGAIEELGYKLLCEECGVEWADLLRWAWGRSREAMQFLNRNVHTCSIEEARGRVLVADLFHVPSKRCGTDIVVVTRTGPDVCGHERRRHFRDF